MKEMQGVEGEGTPSAATSRAEFCNGTRKPTLGFGWAGKFSGQVDSFHSTTPTGGCSGRCPTFRF